MKQKNKIIENIYKTWETKIISEYLFIMKYKLNNDFNKIYNK
jgi:hypothetical protein